VVKPAGCGGTGTCGWWVGQRVGGLVAALLGVNATLAHLGPSATLGSLAKRGNRTRHGANVGERGAAWAKTGSHRPPSSFRGRQSARPRAAVPVLVVVLVVGRV